jgi:hypothetical protein
MVMPTVNEKPKALFNIKTICLKKLSIFAMSGGVIFNAVSGYADNVMSCDTANGAIENVAIIASTMHLTDKKNGTISDPKTGLVWKKCSEGQTWKEGDNTCAGSLDRFNWQEALQRAQDINAARVGENFSQSDWRLPNIKELSSIIELRCAMPALNNTIFPFPLLNSRFFWSSSPADRSAGGVSFVDGEAFRRLNMLANFSVRLVRSGQ